MKWEEITELNPGRFILVEAIKASSNNRVRQLEDMAVIQDYDNPQEAWNGYKYLHKLHPTRELYVFHTSRSDVEVVEEFFSGVRRRMKIQLQHGLPGISLTLTHNNQSIVLQTVLFDTGCAATIFDTDALAEIGIHIDFINGRAKRMYRVRGISEICYEQHIPGLQIEPIALNDFPIQLGSIQEPYGFDGILGIDFMIRAKCKAASHRSPQNVFKPHPL
ncbi:aspartyl protease family protein [Paenibacillus ehimensis]|uniref:hypothetical protein n=1 Tax=Paenibacillus ehimensis TaxID=79264 RepID=UPI002DBAE1D7|nr:hypothetical protein [Paenibacillus ehimensis]MEC0213302.1 aspartyl protease family protein [Paenibacillus ehimensis]